MKFCHSNRSNFKAPFAVGGPRNEHAQFWGFATGSSAVGGEGVPHFHKLTFLNSPLNPNLSICFDSKREVTTFHLYSPHNPKLLQIDNQTPQISYITSPLKPESYIYLQYKQHIFPKSTKSENLLVKSNKFN